jgi:copper homeostasis protein CutC
MRQLEMLRATASKMPESAHRMLRDALPQLSSARKQQIKRLLTEAQQADQS